MPMPNLRCMSCSPHASSGPSSWIRQIIDDDDHPSSRHTYSSLTVFFFVERTRLWYKTTMFHTNSSIFLLLWKLLFIHLISSIHPPRTTQSNARGIILSLSWLAWTWWPTSRLQLEPRPSTGRIITWRFSENTGSSSAPSITSGHSRCAGILEFLIFTYCITAVAYTTTVCNT